jgi:adenylate kinase family enzyme
VSATRPRSIGLVGAPGSGKSYLGRSLADVLGYELIELDELFWRPGWERCPPAEFQERLVEIGRRSHVVVVGNYSKFARLYWPNLCMLVWLDLPTAVTYRRLLRRTISDAVKGRETLPGCRQTAASALEILQEGLTSRRKIRKTIDDACRRHLLPQATIRLRDPREVAPFIEQLAAGRPSGT